MAAQRSVPHYSAPIDRPESLQGDFVGKMVLLLAANVLWNGLGNLAIGDKRGWTFGFINWVVVAIAFFTAWIPAILFFGYCGYAGYQFLLEQRNTVPVAPGRMIT